MAEIIKRAEQKYLVRVFLGRVDGRIRYHNKVFHGTLKDARKYARETEAKRDSGELDRPAADDPIFETFLDEWMLQFKKGTVSERTYDGYEYVLTKYVKPYLGKLRLSELKARTIQSAYNDLSESGLSPRTVKFAHGLIKEALDQAVVDDLLEANPASPTRRPPKKKKPIQVFTPAEAERFMRAAKLDRLGVVLWFALATGTRPEEYLALKWQDVDLQKCSAFIHQTVYFRKGGSWQIEEVKTDSSIRPVKFDSVISNALAEHKKRQYSHALKQGKKYQRNDFVFASRSGTPINLRNLTLRHLVPVMERAKIDGPRNLYRLRHTYATLAMLAGVDDKVISESMGHSTVSFTKDTYQHVLPSMKEEAATKISKMLFGAV